MATPPAAAMPTAIATATTILRVVHLGLGGVGGGAPHAAGSWVCSVLMATTVEVIPVGDLCSLWAVAVTRSCTAESQGSHSEPLLPCVTMTTMVERSELRRPDGQPVRVLVVDDEPTLSELVSMALRLEGWEIRSAADGSS